MHTSNGQDNDGASVDPADLDEEPVEEAAPVDPVAEILRFIFQDETWMARAACRKLDIPVEERLKMFFVHRGQSQKPAKAVCAKCPVRQQCTEYAQRSFTEWGIWGGKIRHRGQAPKRRRRKKLLPPDQLGHF